MSVLINLLPDTRQAKLRARRRRQLVTGGAIATWAVCGGTLALMVLYSTSQKLLINDATGKIAAKHAQLEDIEGLTDALTIQQHLKSLPELYDNRVYLTKFFKAYSGASPQDVKLSGLTVDSGNQLTVTGTGVSYAAVAKLARALEAQNVSVGDGAKEGNQPYFSSVAIQSANRSAAGIGFTMNASIASEVTSGE